jgi:hypothetical protein
MLLCRKGGRKNQTALPRLLHSDMLKSGAVLLCITAQEEAPTIFNFSNYYYLYGMYLLEELLHAARGPLVVQVPPLGGVGHVAGVEQQRQHLRLVQAAQQQHLYFGTTSRVTYGSSILKLKLNSPRLSNAI